MDSPYSQIFFLSHIANFYKLLLLSVLEIVTKLLLIFSSIAETKHVIKWDCFHKLGAARYCVDHEAFALMS